LITNQKNQKKSPQSARQKNFKISFSKIFNVACTGKSPDEHSSILLQRHRIPSTAPTARLRLRLLLLRLVGRREPKSVAGSHIRGRRRNNSASWWKRTTGAVTSLRRIHVSGRIAEFPLTIDRRPDRLTILIQAERRRRYVGVLRRDGWRSIETRWRHRS